MLYWGTCMVPDTDSISKEEKNLVCLCWSPAVFRFAPVIGVRGIFENHVKQRVIFSNNQGVTMSTTTIRFSFPSRRNAHTRNDVKYDGNCVSLM